MSVTQLLPASHIQTPLSYANMEEQASWRANIFPNWSLGSFDFLAIFQAVGSPKIPGDEVVVFRRACFSVDQN